MKIGFQTGEFNNTSRPQTTSTVTFNPGTTRAGGYVVTSEWQSFNISVKELLNGKPVNFTDVTSLISFQGDSDDGGVLQLKNIHFSKTKTNQQSEPGGSGLAGQPAASENYPKTPSGAPILGNSALQAMSYGTFRATSRSEETVPSVNELKEDLRILHAAGIRVLRTYHTQKFSDTQNLLDALVEMSQEDDNFEMYVMMGVWIDALNSFTDQPVNHSQENPDNDNEMAKAIEFAKKYPEFIKVIAVGNEAMVEWATSYRVDPAIILKRVNELQALKNSGEINNDIWITSSDNHAVWAINNGYYESHKADIEALIRAVDYVSIHTYPFHDTKHNSGFWVVPAEEQSLSRKEQADKAMVRAYEEAIRQIKGAQTMVNSIDDTKQIHIGETGWSTLSTEDFGNGGTGAADEYKQKAYYDAMNTWANTFGASLFFFEAFDEPWKGSADTGHSEKHFGLIDINGKAKYLIWDKVDAGAFSSLTRGGNTITKSNNGDQATVESAILAIPYAFNSGGQVTGDKFSLFIDELQSGLTSYGWDNGTGFIGVNTDDKALVVAPAEPKDWGWGTSVAVPENGGQNLTGFENGFLMFEVKGDISGAVTIGFQTGLYGNSLRPQTVNGLEFAGSSSRAITDDWTFYKLAVTDLIASSQAPAPSFDDVTSVFYVQGSPAASSGEIRFRNVRYSKTGDETVPPNNNTGGNGGTGSGGGNTGGGNTGSGSGGTGSGGSNGEVVAQAYIAIVVRMTVSRCNTGVTPGEAAPPLKQ
ncbi:glycoside hydrolase family 17 protein [Veronia nyctiphanis]|uniref:hypothetical protein n=1 Tax=Veronia nyctiphanis TaxID=1278244 RepID=UPI00191BD64A|nr:hypothetical protein [Veronia nyctiphanis]